MKLLLSLALVLASCQSKTPWPHLMHLELFDASAHPDVALRARLGQAGAPVEPPSWGSALPMVGDVVDGRRWRWTSVKSEGVSVAVLPVFDGQRQAAESQLMPWLMTLTEQDEVAFLKGPLRWRRGGQPLGSLPISATPPPRGLPWATVDTLFEAWADRFAGRKVLIATALGSRSSQIWERLAQEAAAVDAIVVVLAWEAPGEGVPIARARPPLVVIPVARRVEPAQLQTTLDEVVRGGHWARWVSRSDPLVLARSLVVRTRLPRDGWEAFSLPSGQGGAAQLRLYPFRWADGCLVVAGAEDARQQMTPLSAAELRTAGKPPRPGTPLPWETQLQVVDGPVAPWTEIVGSSPVRPPSEQPSVIERLEAWSAPAKTPTIRVVLGAGGLARLGDAAAVRLQRLLGSWHGAGQPSLWVVNTPRLQGDRLRRLVRRGGGALVASEDRRFLGQRLRRWLTGASALRGFPQPCGADTGVVEWEALDRGRRLVRTIDVSAFWGRGR